MTPVIEQFLKENPGCLLRVEFYQDTWYVDCCTPLRRIHVESAEPTLAAAVDALSTKLQELSP